MATKNNGQTVKCSHCGTQVEVSQSPSGCSVSCCGEPMKSSSSGQGGSQGGSQSGGSSGQQKGHGK